MSTYHVPQTLEERRNLRNAIGMFVAGKRLTPPVALHTLEGLAQEFAEAQGIGAEWKDWLMVEIHNVIWMPVMAGIPQDRKLLLLPKCLSRSGGCEAEVDEMGLLCHRCGRCVIPSLQDRAAELGVLTLVAEGFTSVIELIENQVVDAVIGVSCLDSLEKAFPLLINHAVPGVAVPLNINGCRDTNVDVDYVLRLLEEHGRGETRLLNYRQLKDTVSGWFSAEQLNELWNTGGDAVQQIAFDWLALDGKRSRPFLLAAVYQAMSGSEELPEEVRKAAVAVECFHKASLVHDDIQDRDSLRYGQPTVYVRYGEAIAINTGDLLLGQGYRLLASCEHRELLTDVCQAHVALCQGQGTELAWMRNPSEVTLDFVLDIFAHKTVPAFEVALQLGLTCAGCQKESVRETLKAYCHNLGIAYQLSDDIEDYLQDNVSSHRPTAFLAVQASHPDWTKEQLVAEVWRLTDQYQRAALDALNELENIELKRLLYQVTAKLIKRPKQVEK